MTKFPSLLIVLPILAAFTISPARGQAGANQGLTRGVEPLEDDGSDQVGVTSDTFYSDESLNNNGRWISVKQYGRCWQPTGCPADWRPYTRGSFRHSEESGWTWVSDPTEEEWGWAVYHYGRWFQVKGVGCGWAWVPGTEWAGAWVSWRQGQTPDCTCVGWAPLPPEAACKVNVGVSTWADREYDIGPDHYTFVHVRDFGSDSYERCGCVLERRRYVNIVEHTTNITNISFTRRVNVHVNIYNGGPDFNWCNTEIRRHGGREIAGIRINLFESRERFGGKYSRFEGNVLALHSPRVVAVRTPKFLPKIAATVPFTKIDRGWGSVNDPKIKAQLKTKIADQTKGQTPATTQAKRPNQDEYIKQLEKLAKQQNEDAAKNAGNQIKPDDGLKTGKDLSPEQQALIANDPLNIKGKGAAAGNTANPFGAAGPAGAADPIAGFDSEKSESAMGEAWKNHVAKNGYTMPTDPALVNAIKYEAAANKTTPEKIVGAYQDNANKKIIAADPLGINKGKGAPTATGNAGATNPNIPAPPTGLKVDGANAGGAGTFPIKKLGNEADAGNAAGGNTGTGMTVPKDPVLTDAQKAMVGGNPGNAGNGAPEVWDQRKGATDGQTQKALKDAGVAGGTTKLGEPPKELKAGAAPAKTLRPGEKISDQGATKQGGTAGGANIRAKADMTDAEYAKEIGRVSEANDAAANGAGTVGTKVKPRAYKPRALRPGDKTSLAGADGAAGADGTNVPNKPPTTKVIRQQQNVDDVAETAGTAGAPGAAGAAGVGAAGQSQAGKAGRSGAKLINRGPNAGNVNALDASGRKAGGAQQEILGTQGTSQGGATKAPSTRNKQKSVATAGQTGTTEGNATQAGQSAWGKRSKQKRSEGAAHTAPPEGNAEVAKGGGKRNKQKSSQGAGQMAMAQGAGAEAGQGGGGKRSRRGGGGGAGKSGATQGAEAQAAQGGGGGGKRNKQKNAQAQGQGEEKEKGKGKRRNKNAVTDPNAPPP